MRLVLRRLAKADLSESFRWYEERQAGLGQAFLDYIDATLSIITEHPRIFPRVDPLTRRASVERFPYGVFFRLDGDVIRVIAILHNARDPKRWQRRT
jgi:plasmid stabilization system protein ParE